LLFQKCIHVLFELLDNDKILVFYIFFIVQDYFLSTFLIWSMLLGENKIVMLDKI